ncbi:hypothetical protein Ae201684P_004082 [Aphanomyces euteiches]|uniref:Globin domain-containing protein n=1 Tax=Aphanomyces euteiches TaxID=100861 RepID=A0A6G0XSZ4_9STRA|nr:hypothetical protein Ae201684_001695 [Aphanomyces euteiches]KAH9075402.1 hypothetical protein Ae201684P_004082 [Aphanomyces euteiches]KAH9154428.1 hypothetical protein AeRB84_003466 [Aphanomyces euteiches]
MGTAGTKQAREPPTAAAIPQNGSSRCLNATHGPKSQAIPSTQFSGARRHSEGRGKSMFDPNVDTGEMIQLFSYERCPRAVVHHYIPANLPMMPIFTETYLSDCNNSWTYILTSSTDRMKDFSKPGIVLFYDEFFFRLFQRDESFKEVFPDIRRRGEVLIKALTLLLKSSSDDNARLVNKIRYLGHRHRYFPKIRAFQFATYGATMIEVVMYWLGELATPDIAEAWSNVVCFFMKHMLEAFLTNRVDPFESYQNTVTVHMRALSEMDDEEKKTAKNSNGSKGSRGSRASTQR